MHHYFEEKVCTFHHWALYVRPRKGWEEYRKLVELERAAVGYHLTFPSDDVIQSVVVGSHTPQTPPSQKETVQNSVPGDLKAEGEGLHSSDSAAAQATA